MLLVNQAGNVHIVVFISTGWTVAAAWRENVFTSLMRRAYKLGGRMGATLLCHVRFTHWSDITLWGLLGDNIALTRMESLALLAFFFVCYKKKRFSATALIYFSQCTCDVVMIKLGWREQWVPSWWSLVASSGVLYSVGWHDRKQLHIDDAK